MTDKQKKITEEGVLKADMEQLMTPQAVKELGALSPTMQQFLLRWQDKRDMILGDQLKEELKEFLLGVYEADNDKLCKDVVEVIGQELRPINSTLLLLSTAVNNMAADVTDIKDDVSSIKGRLEVIEKRLDADEVMIKGFEERLAVKRQRIEILEKEVKMLRPDIINKLLEEIHFLDPIIKKLIRTQAWWNIALRILIAVTISTIITLLVHYNMPHKYELKPDQRVEIITR